MSGCGRTLLECDGGAITLAYTLVERVTLCATDDTALIIEETQDVVGQGPGHDAFSTGHLPGSTPSTSTVPTPGGRCSSRRPHRPGPRRHPRPTDGADRQPGHRGT